MDNSSYHCSCIQFLISRRIILSTTLILILTSNLEIRGHRLHVRKRFTTVGFISFNFPSSSNLEKNATSIERRYYSVKWRKKLVQLINSLYIVFFSLKNISIIWRSHTMHWRRMFLLKPGAGRGGGLYRFTPAMKRDLCFNGLKIDHLLRIASF